MYLHIKRKGKRSVVHIDGSTAHNAMRTCQTDPVGRCKSRTIASTQKNTNRWEGTLRLWECLPSLPSFHRPHRFSSRLWNNTVEIAEVEVVEEDVDDDNDDGTLVSSTKMRPTTMSSKVKNRKATERMNFSNNRCSLFCTFSIAALIFILMLLMFMPKVIDLCCQLITLWKYSCQGEGCWLNYT